jgi:protein-disulfide isomerase
VLLGATVAALIWANVPWGSTYEDVWTTELSIRLGDAALSLDLRHWVNDGLMTFFFFVVGLEIRREFDMGELRERRRLATPVVAAVGGMVAPALLYLAFTGGTDGARGWGIVMGTDTAFALGVLALVGRTCPPRIRVFLLTLVIVDDIIALTVIALVYTDEVSVVALVVAVALFGVAILMRQSGDPQRGRVLRGVSRHLGRDGRIGGASHHRRHRARSAGDCVPTFAIGSRTRRHTVAPVPGAADAGVRAFDECEPAPLGLSPRTTGLSFVVFRVIGRLPERIFPTGASRVAPPIVDLADPVDPERDHIRWSDDAPVALVEYADFECPYCGQAEPVVRDLLGSYGADLRYVFRHLPLTDVHEHAELAAEAAEAAGAEGRFWEMHDRLFAGSDALELDDLIGYARELGLDVQKFSDALRSRTYALRVARDVESADDNRVAGTPTFFVNGRRHHGAYDIDSLRAAIDREIRARPRSTGVQQ